jgi:thiamine biosynthesis lipoprotein
MSHGLVILRSLNWIVLGWLLIARTLLAEMPAPLVQLAGVTMGTTYSIQYVSGETGASREQLHRLVEAKLDALDAIFSTYRSDSQLAQLQQAEQQTWQPISRELFEVLELSQAIKQRSGGAFDIQIAPLVALWKQAASLQQLPSAEAITQQQRTLATQAWELRKSPYAIRKESPQFMCDVNGIVPGYAVDQLAQLLDQEKIAEYLIELGGEVRAQGNRPWQVAIETPAGETATQHRQVLFTLPMVSGAVATSGDYRQGYEIAGKRYSHILDPRTGWPVPHRQASVTVVMADCASADAWATALSVLGPEAGLRLATEQNLAVCFVTKTSTGFDQCPSPAFAARFPQVSAHRMSPSGVHWWMAFVGGCVVLLVVWMLLRQKAPRTANSSASEMVS